MLPKMSFLDSFDEFDGGVYEAGESWKLVRHRQRLHLHAKAKKWEPDLGFLNSAKGAVIWPPGYLHETSTLPPPDAWQ